MFDRLISEISEEMAPFRSQVADIHAVRCALALSRQKRVAEANARLRRRHVEGLGEVVASIDAELFWQLVCKHDVSYKDPEFLKCLLRDNEELRVKCEPDHLTLRVNGLRPCFGVSEDGVSVADNDVAETEAAPLEAEDRQYFSGNRAAAVTETPSLAPRGNRNTEAPAPAATAA